MISIQKLFISLILLFVSVTTVFAQKKIIDHTVYNSWNSLRNQNVSSLGSYVTYEINPHRGDGKLIVYTAKSKTKVEIAKAKNAVFSDNEKIVAFSIDAGFDTLRYMKLNDIEKDKWVKDTLGIYFTKKDSLVKVSNLVDYAIAKKGNILAYTIKDIKKNKPKKKKRWFRSKKEIETNKEGNTLFLLNTETGERKKIENVTDFKFNDQGTHLFFVKVIKKGGDELSTVQLYDFVNQKVKKLSTQFTELGNYGFSDRGNEFVFMASTDTSKALRSYDVYQWSLHSELPEVLVTDGRSDLPDGLTPAPKGRVYFSLDESKLFFGLRTMPIKEEKDTLLDNEKAVLDVWHYKNNRLQPQQLNELKRDQNENLLTVLHLKENILLQLESDTLSVRILDQGNSDYAMGVSNEQYAYANNWRYPWPDDFYRVNVKTGKNELIKANIDYSIGLNPNGSRFTYFNSAENNYYYLDVETKVENCMTCFIKDPINWKSDINGMPFEANPEGSPGYLSNDEIVLYSEFDIWTYNYVTSVLTPITKKEGNPINMIYRLKQLDYDSTFMNLSDSYIIGIDQESMNEYIYTYVDDRLSPHLVKWFETDHKITSIEKASNGDKLIFRQMSIEDYPEVYLTNSKFENTQKISKTNPQQSEYNWATVEQMEWESYNGEKLKGLLYKPEDFDSTKSYPLMVYFYEMYSDKKNYHYIPRPTASIIFATEYASAGYLVFIPDIRYEPGYPARGAYNSIMSGTDKVLEMYPNVDSTRMGLQGQSWGGYQTAQLITMTERYAAAMAGAPVSNMFSAYGGIRWGSGYSRAFQYEHTQSRIGKTIWEAPELYIENSPLFGIPNITTPLLIMHNDGDGAVPWYQGIEMFTGMKRLNKPVWMLNYNGDEHNLMKNANRMDLSIRMRQFFDYYLQGKPAPEWLINGVPALDKGKKYGLNNYELK
ncbi:S9 family peptidase [Brumimicrobium glaciale]|uniref:S9 family peptidase n=1 Tax=Brumimicrobium glaciale TaxID=200475 RepID=A0A4Q4KKJ9_9FLAO|nr:prolyl oligopeptidase family serine peptidase [Brumimicrobium glaciale]RYM33861.1 S9 family peptidase [Brumimicrobium glaciale]